MKLSKNIGAAILAGSISSGVSADTHETAEKIGDILQLAIPVAAALCAYEKGGTSELKGMIAKTATGQVIVSGSKIALGDHPINKRPNGSSNGGFPSGHTYAASSGAGYLSNNCLNKNWKYTPHILAAFTGWSREVSRNHTAEQVLIGYLLGMFMNLEDEDKYLGVGTWINNNSEISTGIQLKYRF